MYNKFSAKENHKATNTAYKTQDLTESIVPALDCKKLKCLEASSIKAIII